VVLPTRPDRSRTNQSNKELFLRMTTRYRITFSEKQAALIWQQSLGRKLTSTEDEQFNVIYPGRINGDSGPDFRDAVIVDESRLVKGDVEVHVRSSDWYSHKHHADIEYNNVILHVVMRHDCGSPTVLRSGRKVPVLCLPKALRHQTHLLPYALPCSPILDHIEGQAFSSGAETGAGRSGTFPSHHEGSGLC
jgi:hypothetical protein